MTLVIVHLYPKLSVYNSNMKIQLHKESVVVLHPLGEYQNCEWEHHQTVYKGQGRIQDFSGVGDQPNFFLDFGYTCRESVSRC